MGAIKLRRVGDRGSAPLALRNRDTCNYLIWQGLLVSSPGCPGCPANTNKRCLRLAHSSWQFDIHDEHDLIRRGSRGKRGQACGISGLQKGRHSRPPGAAGLELTALRIGRVTPRRNRPFLRFGMRVPVSGPYAAATLGRIAVEDAAPVGHSQCQRLLRARERAQGFIVHTVHRRAEGHSYGAHRPARCPGDELANGWLVGPGVGIPGGAFADSAGGCS